MYTGRASPLPDEKRNTHPVAAFPLSKSFGEPTVSIKCLGRCGTYHIRESVIRELANIRRGIRPTDQDLVSYLSCHTRQRHEQKEPALVDENWRALAEGHRALSLQERCDRLLLLVNERTRRVGVVVSMNRLQKDGPLAGEPSPRNLDQILYHLCTEELIEALDIPEKLDPDDYPTPGSFALTFRGKLKCDELKKDIGSPSSPVPESSSGSGIEQQDESQESRARRRQAWLGPLLEKEGLTRSGLATKARLTHKTISNYWHGLTQKLRPSSRKDIADLLGVEPTKIPESSSLGSWLACSFFLQRRRSGKWWSSCRDGSC